MRKTALAGWLGLTMAISCASGTHAEPLATETLRQAAGNSAYVAEGVVEAVRSSSIGADISGRVTALLVKAGDRVKAGQVLARIDERVAAQQALASKAQSSVAEADFARQKKLREQNFISQAALDRAESNYRSASAQAAAAGVEAGLRTLSAPYNGVVAETAIELGDMVVPGKPLLLVYDPSAMRVTVNVPQSQLAGLKSAPVTVEIPGAAAPALTLAPGSVTVLPTADPVTHMVQVRLALPTGGAGLSPGMFARAQLPMQGLTTTNRVTVPSSAVITRSELTAVYVVDDAGKAALRQVRLGRRQGERIEVLAGLDANEKIALDPLAAAKQR